MGNFFTTGWNRGIPQAFNAWGEMAKARQEEKMAEPMAADLMKRFGSMLGPDTVAAMSKMKARDVIKMISSTIPLEQASQQMEMEQAKNKAMEGLTRQVTDIPMPEIGMHPPAMGAPPIPPMGNIDLSGAGRPPLPPPEVGGMQPPMLNMPKTMPPPVSRPATEVDIRARMPELLKFLSPEKAMEMLSRDGIGLKPGEGQFTLGDTRYDAQGKPIVSNKGEGKPPTKVFGIDNKGKMTEIAEIPYGSEIRTVEGDPKDETEDIVIVNPATGELKKVGTVAKGTRVITKPKEMAAGKEPPPGYKEDLAAAVAATNQGRDAMKVFRKMAAVYPSMSSELKRILVPSAGGSDVYLNLNQ